MSRVREIIHGASIASTCWGNGTLRVYFQDAKGGIREFKGAWSGGTDYDRRFGARPNCPLAIVQWMAHDKSCVRLYCLDTDNNIQEHCCDGSDWFSGALTKSGVVAAPFSKLAAARWDSNIRVYYETRDGIIREHCCTMGKWYAGAVLPTPPSRKPLRGTSIASSSIRGNPIFVYFQDEDGGIREIKHEREWSVGSVICQARSYTPLAVVQWEEDGKYRIRLYCLDKNNIIQEHCWDHSNWFPGSLTNSGVVAAPCSKLTAVRWGPDIRVYYQPNNDTNIHEYGIGLRTCGWRPSAVLAVTRPNSSQKTKPVDINGVTYPTGLLPWVLDCAERRNYDPSEIDGAGMIIGFIDGRIIGEDLKTKKCTALKPNDESTSYTWVYTPENAIIYRFLEQDSKKNYICHSQPGRGKPVTCAGEFRVNRMNRIDSLIATTNDRGGYRNLDGGECLDGVATKLAKLGIETERNCWFYGAVQVVARD